MSRTSDATGRSSEADAGPESHAHGRGTWWGNPASKRWSLDPTAIATRRRPRRGPSAHQAVASLHCQDRLATRSATSPPEIASRAALIQPLIDHQVRQTLITEIEVVIRRKERTLRTVQLDQDDRQIFTICPYVYCGQSTPAKRMQFRSSRAARTAGP